MTKTAYEYVKATLVASSPIKLGSGEDAMSDADVLVDASGTAYIPGTTLAGVMRHYVKAARAKSGLEAKAYVDNWFGHIVPKVDDGSESLVRVYDAFACGKPSVSMRDGVRLTDQKTASPQGKFDYQVVDAKATFELRMRLECRENTKDEADELVACVMQGFQSGEIMVGGKTSRGFGRFEVEDVKWLYVDLGDPDGVKRYIEFDWKTSPFAAFTLGDAKPVLYDEEEEVSLQLVSPLIVRDYATVARSGHEQKLVDAETLTDNEGRPLIPGTSWAGAFRHHMRWILVSCGYGSGDAEAVDGFLNKVFGEVAGGARASMIEFSETPIKGSKKINYTRTAVDRFTGGAADQMLFTNRIAYGGTTTLRIRWRTSLGDRTLDESEKQLLKSLVTACVNDLCDGYLAVGGMTATGCGIFGKCDAKKGEVA